MWLGVCVKEVLLIYRQIDRMIGWRLGWVVARMLVLVGWLMVWMIY